MFFLQLWRGRLEPCFGFRAQGVQGCRIQTWTMKRGCRASGLSSQALKVQNPLLKPLIRQMVLRRFRGTTWKILRGRISGFG